MIPSMAIAKEPISKKWVIVQAYKHDGRLHRQWSPAFLLEETDEYWALGSRASLVTESDGRRWMTKEPAIFLLFKDKWMNVLAMQKENGICYYVNIATPTILDEGYLKYIDYDLDVKLFPDDRIKELDEYEYLRHEQTYGYSTELRKAIRKAMDEAEDLLKVKAFPFQDEEIARLFAIFERENRPYLPPKTNNK